MHFGFVALMYILVLKLSYLLALLCLHVPFVKLSVYGEYLNFGALKLKGLLKTHSQRHIIESQEFFLLMILTLKG